MPPSGSVFFKFPTSTPAQRVAPKPPPVSTPCASWMKGAVVVIRMTEDFSLASSAGSFLEKDKTNSSPNLEGARA